MTTSDRHHRHFLTTYQAAVEEISTALSDVPELLATEFPADDHLRAEATRFVMQGGKRFRPVLSLLVARAYGTEATKVHTALEVFHKYMLAHDDIIDRDDMRYGQPAIHTAMATFSDAQNVQERQHFGNSLAMIAGNLMAGTTSRIILGSDLPDSTKLQLQGLINQSIEEVTWGWYDQFLMDYLPLDSPNLNFARIEKSIIWVTGKYSIKLPLLFGLAVAGQKNSAKVEELADVMGALFQTGDDIIGVFGQTAKTGKSSYSDISQGKKTLPLWLAYERATTADKKILVELIGKKDITAAEVTLVRDMLHRSGGYEAAQKIMADYSKKCQQLLQEADLPDDLKNFLRGFITHLTTRES